MSDPVGLPPWWSTAPPVELTVPCGGAVHRLRWSAGRVESPDHPDLDAERALIALGGEEPSCLAHLDLWADAVADGGFLGEWVDDTQLTEARSSWLGMALERMRAEGFHEFLRRLPPARAERMGHFLHRFPRPWHDRAAGAVAAAVVDGAGVACADAPLLLPTAIANRLRRAFVTSVGPRQLSVGAAALVPLSIRVEGDRAPTVRGRLTGPGRGVELVVDPGWLHRVWAAGAAVTDGELVLAVEPAGGRDPASATVGARLTVVAWHRGEHGWSPTVEHRSAALTPSAWRLDPTSPGHDSTKIRLVTEDELPRLQAIERAAGALFADSGMPEVADDEPPSLSTLAGYQQAGRAWAQVTDLDRPVAYLIADVVDGAVHIEQVSVDPVYARQGLGKGLIDHVAEWARERGFEALTLTTFMDVQWNGPYYQRCGFRVLDDRQLTQGLRAIRAREAADGLDRWPRACMLRRL